MPFATPHLNDPQRTGAGERYGDNVVVLSAALFAPALNVGRFARMNGATLTNMDATATPNVAGVVLRSPAASIEAGLTIDANLTSAVEYVRAGLVTVEVLTGQAEPAAFAAVFAHNTGAESGRAAVAGIATGAEFIRVERPGVWLVRLR